MSYLTAEQLAHHDSLSEQEIMRVMSDTAYRQQLSTTSSGRPVAPLSALSLEEHRILQSLDRLNDKLKSMLLQLRQFYDLILLVPPSIRAFFLSYSADELKLERFHSNLFLTEGE